MKRLGIILLILAIFAALYYGVDTLFEIYSNREIVIGLFVLVIIVMLYFSLKPCFSKKDK